MKEKRSETVTEMFGKIAKAIALSKDKLNTSST